ncbi:MAG: CcdB family protein [Pseudomonadota bacterium]
MKPFDAFEIDDPGGAVGVVVLQGAYYLDLPTVLVAPLYRLDSGLKYDIINPEVSFYGDRLIVKLDRMAALPADTLVRRIGSILAYADEIKNALDRLIGGY